MKTACYIPARLGSERVVRKNLRLLNGTPLISYACKQLIQVSNADYVCVNTESEEIAQAVKNTGINVYMRPAHLAESHVKTDDIVIDFINNNTCDAVFLINPTAPFLTKKTIERFIDSFLKSKSDSMFSCTNVKRHAVFNGEPVNFNFGGKSPRTQDLSPIKIIDFIMCGFSTKSALRHFEEYGSFLYRGNVSFFDTPENESVDIDTETEFKMAELLISTKEV